MVKVFETKNCIIIVLIVILLCCAVFIYNDSMTLNSFNQIYTNEININAYFNGKNDAIKDKLFDIHRGIWIQLPYKSCVVTKHKFIDDGPYNANFKGNYEETLKNYTNVTTEFLKNEFNNDYQRILCDYKKSNKFPEWLMNIHSQLYQIYVNKMYKPYYYLYDSNEINQCFVQLKNVLFWGDSVLETIFHEIVSFILNKEDVGGTMWAKSHINAGNFNITTTPDRGVYPLRNETVYYSDKDGNQYMLYFTFVLKDLHSNGVGLIVLEYEEIRSYFKQYIKRNNIKTIVFNSLMHDYARQRNHNDDPPQKYYKLLQKLILFLVNDVYENNLDGVTIYIWSGLKPAIFMRGKQGAYLMQTYLYTMIKSFNDFLNDNKYGYLLKYIKWIDTYHVSDGFDHVNGYVYGDGTHYGMPNHEYNPNTSRIVNKMATQIILNQICPLHTN